MKSLDELHEELDTMKLRTMVNPNDEEAWEKIKTIVNQIKNYRTT